MWNFNVRYKTKNLKICSIKNECIYVTPSSKVTLGDIFMLKALFHFEIFSFLSWLFGYAEKQLDKKANFNFKICDVTDYTRNAIHIVLNISRRKCNQAMKFWKKWDGD